MEDQLVTSLPGVVRSILSIFFFILVIDIVEKLCKLRTLFSWDTVAGILLSSTVLVGLVILAISHW